MPYSASVAHELEHLREQLAARDEVWLATRIQALVTYGLMAALVGLVMTFTGAPVLIESTLGPWARVLFGVPAVISGALILMGVTRSTLDRYPWVLTLLGVSGFCLVSLAIAGTYIYASFQERVQWVSPGEAIDPSSSRPYVPIVYIFIAVLLLLHIIALVRLRPVKMLG